MSSWISFFIVYVGIKIHSLKFFNVHEVLHSTLITLLNMYITDISSKMKCNYHVWAWVLNVYFKVFLTACRQDGSRVSNSIEFIGTLLQFHMCIPIQSLVQRTVFWKIRESRCRKSCFYMLHVYFVQNATICGRLASFYFAILCVYETLFLWKFSLPPTI